MNEQRKRGEMQEKHRKMWKLVNKVCKPKDMCTSCFNRVVGRPVTPGDHSAERPNCRLFLVDKVEGKRMLMLKVVKHVRKPKSMCTSCFDRFVGRPVVAGRHTYERGNCALGPH